MEKRPKAKRAPGERSAKRPIDREWDHGFRTALGPIVIRWREGAGGPLVTRIFLPAEPAPGGARRGAANGGRRSCARIDALSRRIAAFCAGKAVSLGMELLDWSLCGAFQRAVLRAEHGIPRGSVSTYGRIARRIGHPLAARAVGTALARNPFPLVIPCHRAVREGGAIGGFRGGVRMKRRLLELEGIAFAEDGRVAMERLHCYYKAAPPRSDRRGAAQRKERA